MCCTRLAANTERKNDAKNRHLRTIAQLCPAVSSQLRHILTIGKKLVKQKYVLHMSAATSLTGGQPNFPQCLAISWAGTLRIHFSGILPLTKFCPVHNSLYVQVLRSPILAALLHGTAAAGVSQTLRCRTRNRITELSQRALPIFSRVAITLGIGPHSSYFFIACLYPIKVSLVCKMLQNMHS